MREKKIFFAQSKKAIFFEIKNTINNFFLIVLQERKESKKRQKFKIKVFRIFRSNFFIQTLRWAHI